MPERHSRYNAMTLQARLDAFKADFEAGKLPCDMRPSAIGQDGIILYAEVNPGHTRRPGPEDMLPAIRYASASRAA